jgi:hypothetical protein
MTRRYESNLKTYFSDRRCGQDRRIYSYALHIPERRTGTDRRFIKDRRAFLERRKISGNIVKKPEIETK